MYDSFKVQLTLFVSFLGVILFCGIFFGCSNADRTKQTLVKMGFTEIETTGYSPFACGKNDWYCTGFKAKNTQGVPIEGSVGCGLIFKGCTVRL